MSSLPPASEPEAPAATPGARRRLQPWQKLVLLAIVGGAGLAFSTWYFGDDLRDPKALAKRLKELVGGLGILAPAGFVAIVSVGPFLFLPAIPLTAAGGFLFGPVWGAVWSLTGNVIGAVLSFLAGRTLAREFVEKRATGKLLTVKSMIEREGWRFVAFIRLVPMFPFGLINMTLGTTSITLRSYTITTALCMAPGAFVYAWLGHTAGAAATGAENTLRNIGIAVGLVLLLMGIPAAVRYAKYRQSLEKLKRERNESGDVR